MASDAGPYPPMASLPEESEKSPKAAPPLLANAPEPTATELVAMAPVPMAMVLVPVDWLLRPTATAPEPEALAVLPTATEDVPPAELRYAKRGAGYAGGMASRCRKPRNSCCWRQR